MRNILAALCVGAVLAPVGPAGAEEDVLPVSVQVVLLFKVLPYDRGFAARAADGVTVGVVFAPRKDASRVEKAAFVTAFNDAQRRAPSGELVQLEEIPEDRLEASAAACDVLFLVDGVDYAAAAEVLGRLDRPSFAAAEAATFQGVPIAFVPRNGRPRILVNSAAATDAGMVLDARFVDLTMRVDAPD